MPFLWIEIMVGKYASFRLPLMHVLAACTSQQVLTGKQISYETSVPFAEVLGEKIKGGGGG